KLTAFNIGWHQGPKRTIYSFIPPKGFLTRPGFANHLVDHGSLYPGFPELRTARKAEAQAPGMAANVLVSDWDRRD
ncbi:MAG: hypothetical protein ACREFO_15365, partial [Acetobacteraceae bacterium]